MFDWNIKNNVSKYWKYGLWLLNQVWRVIINHSIKIFADETKYTKTKFNAQIKFWMKLIVKFDSQCNDIFKNADLVCKSWLQ